MTAPSAPSPRRRRARRAAVAAVLGVCALVMAWGPAAHAQVGDAAVFTATGILAYQERRYEEALEALRQALEMAPDNVEALYYAGLTHLALARYPQAAQLLERARLQAPGDEAVQYQLGALYFGLGEYDRARPLLDPLFGRRPALDSLGYYVGFMRYRERDYQGALRAFRAGTTTSPDVAQLTRFYTGLALGVLGLPEQAAAEIEDALRVQPASPLTGPAERLRDAVLATRRAERRFRAEVRLGLFYDDNVPVVPDASADVLVQALRGGDRTSTGELASVRLEYTFLRTGGLEASAAFQFFTTYNNDLPAFNIVDYLGSVSAGYRDTVASLPYVLTLQYVYDYLTLDGEEFVQRHTVAPAFTLVESARHLTAVQARYQSKDYARDTGVPAEERRDAHNWMAGFLHVLRFAGDRHLLKLGYQLDYEAPKGGGRRGANFEYLGHRFLAGAQYTLPWGGVKLRWDLAVHLRDYLNEHSLLPLGGAGTRERFDREFVNVVGVSVPLPRGLSLAVDYQSTVARSNLDVFSYTRHFVSGTVVWSY